jgi:hypothetical protein
VIVDFTKKISLAFWVVINPTSSIGGVFYFSEFGSDLNIYAGSFRFPLKGIGLR